MEKQVGEPCGKREHNGRGAVMGGVQEVGGDGGVHGAKLGNRQDPQTGCTHQLQG